MGKVILENTKHRNLIGVKLRTLIGDDSKCKIVSAYVSNSEIFQDLERIESLKLICNARSPSTNPFTLELLLNSKRVEIKSRQDIHVKVYIFEDKALITSANATPNGLGQGTIEAAFLLESTREVREITSRFESLWEHQDTEDVRKFTNIEWEKLKSQWKLNNSRNELPKLIDLINTRSIPKNVVFCFWHNVNDAPSKKKVYTASSEQGAVELPNNMDNWDYWIEGSADDINVKTINKVLRRYYPNICVNIETNNWPATKIYKRSIFPSRLLDKAIVYEYRKNNLVLALYRTDKVKLPFKVDSEAIKLINASLQFNKPAWNKYYDTQSGKMGICDSEQLYKLVNKHT